MKYFLILILLILLAFVAPAQVGVHTDTPDNSSAMDIVASNRGLLIPRVTLTSDLSNPSPVTSPATGLLVFNSGANQTVGFYYWNGSAWVLLGGGGGGGGDYWSLTGNSGTIPGTNYVGTSDNNHFIVKTNNAERMRFESDGQLIIGGTTPQSATHLMTVYGNTTQNFAIATYSPTVGYYNLGGRYGVFSQVDTACNPNPGYAVYAKNTDASGYSIYAVGSNVSSLPLITNHTAGITTYGFDGLHAWGRNTTTGHGLCAIGSGQNSSFALTNISSGLSAVGNYGIIARGTNSSGRGIIAIGSGMSVPSTTTESEGAAFTGFHGVFGQGNGYVASPFEIAGIGVIGIGYNYSTYSLPADGLSSGGSFSGDFGVYAKGLSATGIGAVAVGNNGSGYYTLPNGSGGAFTGYHGLLSVGNNITGGIGVVAAGNDGTYSLMPSTGAGGSFTGTNIGSAGFGTSASGGIGVVGAGNATGALIPVNGAGGSFTGNVGSYSKSIAANGTGVIGLGNNIATPGTFAGGAGGAFTGTVAGGIGWGTTAANGTGLLGAGNNIATPLTYTNGSGGAFTGTAAGVVAYGTTAATGIGVIGIGNNTTTQIPATGCGGAFAGVTCGVYGYATSTANSDRYGGYFQTSGAYAYVGVRFSNTNRKILGTNSVSTIVKDTNGNRVILTCPEAPETVFQDFGTGQLVNGFAHIEIDPILVININVDENHPLKVYITPEGDCNGVYVTNKSAEGFDVVELMGGKSNVQFSWQIVATRADETYILEDGRVEVAVNSERFPPGPGPLEAYKQQAVVNQLNMVQTTELKTEKTAKENYFISNDSETKSLTIEKDNVVKFEDNLEN